MQKMVFLTLLSVYYSFLKIHTQKLYCLVIEGGSTFFNFKV